MIILKREIRSVKLDCYFPVESSASQGSRGLVCHDSSMNNVMFGSQIEDPEHMMKDKKPQFLEKFIMNHGSERMALDVKDIPHQD